MTNLPKILAAADAARLLGLSPSTLAKLRLSGKGPLYCKLGRRVLYRSDDLSDWIVGNRRRSTSQLARPNSEPTGGDP